MTAPVDVLAVMDREIGRWDGLDSYAEGKDLIAARAAVAELLEALDNVRDRLGVVIECDNEDHGGASPDDVSAYDRAAAALARCKGGAA